MVVAKWDLRITDTSEANFPGTIANQTYWVRANTMGLSDDDPVSVWDDESPSGLDVASGANPPIFKAGILNSLPIVRFDGTNDILAVTAGSPDPAGLRGDHTGFAVVKFTKATSNNQVILRTCALANCNNQRRNYLGVRGSSGQLTYFDTNSSWVESDHSPDTTDFHVYTWRYNALTETSGGWTLTEWWVDGVATATNSSLGREVSNHDRFAIGEGGAGTSFFGGDIAEIITYDRLLTNTERGQIESHLLNKYGL